MKCRFLAAALLFAALACAAAAESTGNAQWIGVWQGTLDGQPSVTLTLARDTGQLDGTLVLNVVKKEKGGKPYVAATEPHVLVNPRFDGGTLSFAVRKPDAAGDLLNFTVALTPEGKARIHCTNCGKDAPVVDMDRSQ
jgi:hypothetical protein